MRRILIATFAALAGSPVLANDPIIVSAETLRSSSRVHMKVVAKITNLSDQHFDVVWFTCNIVSGGRVVEAATGIRESLRPLATVYKELVVDRVPNAKATCEFDRAMPPAKGASAARPGARSPTGNVETWFCPPDGSVHIGITPPKPNCVMK